MKKSSYKPGFILIFTVCLLSANLNAQEVNKEFHKEFTTAAGTILDLSNKYGNINIQSWDKDQVVIDVKVSVEMPDKEKAQKFLDYIDVQFSQSGNTISAATVIDEKFNFSGWGIRNRKFSIVYDVKMPASLNLNLANRYGNIDIDAVEGLVNIDIKYGDLTAGKLTHGNDKPMSALKIAYGKATIDQAGWLDVYARYSPKIYVVMSQALLLDSKYSKVQIDEASSMVGESKYDDLRIGKINNLVLEAGYDEVKVGTLRKKLDFNGSFGSFSAESVPSGFESIKIDSKYTGVQLGIDESASYKLNARVSYGGLKFNEDKFKSQKHIVGTTSNETSGVMGKQQNPSSEVIVDSSYGTIRLN
jgi:hypothetical protein